MQPNFSKVSEIVAECERLGNKFFSPDAMRAWGTVIPSQTVSCGKYFITYEETKPDSAKYIVREVRYDDTETISIVRPNNVSYENCCFETYREARAYLLELQKIERENLKERHMGYRQKLNELLAENTKLRQEINSIVDEMLKFRETPEHGK